MDRPPARLLVVEDDDNIRDFLIESLNHDRYDVTAVADGQSALAVTTNQEFDVALLDINLPGMDGVTVLRSIRERLGPTALPVIMVTGMAGRDDVVNALRMGANDYVTKPFEMPIVQARIQTQLALKRSAADLENANRELARANRQMKSDLESAARLQRSLLPTAVPVVDGFRFAWVYRPCDELAGDILNIFEIDRNHVALYLLDVSGHGVKAALLSTALSRILTPQPDHPSLVRRRGDDGELTPTAPLEVVLELNRRFQFDDQNEQYFSLFYGVVDLRRRELQYVCAGQPGPILVPFDAPPQDLAKPAFAIGWSPRPGYETSRVAFRPGDRLLACSDGIDEARSAQKEVFGSRRIIGLAGESREGTLDNALARIVEAAQRWTGGVFEDDVSAIAIEGC